MDDLYFFEAGDGGPIKIGRSRNVKKRLYAVQTSSPQKVRLLAVLGGEGWNEKVWHSVFRDLRMSGEWFEPDDDLLKAINLAAKGEDWWHHLDPPDDYDLGDEDEIDDDIVDWHIAIMWALKSADKALPGDSWDCAETVSEGLAERLDRLVEAGAPQ